MRKISADWIFPVSSSPVQNGVVIIDDDGKIISLAERQNFEDAEPEKYPGIICPGFINAHCHLELSYLKGKISEHTGLTGFISEFLKKRNDSDPDVSKSIEEAEKEMMKEGIVGVGDISNSTVSFEQKSKGNICYHTFVECFGVPPEKAESFFQSSLEVFREARKLNLAASISPHAPYSMSDELFKIIFSFEENHPPIFSYHNQETEEENKLYRGEKSMFGQFYADFRLPSTQFRKGNSSLQAHLKFFPPEKKILFVHNTATSRDDVEFAVKEHPNLYWCLCPNANLYIEGHLPNFQNFIPFNDRICIGTDSYASNHRLSILEEMKEIQKSDSSITTQQLIQRATWNGARFFGWNELGSIEAGKRPGLNLISDLNKDLTFSKNSTVSKLA